jgi:TonB family protein
MRPPYRLCLLEISPAEYRQRRFSFTVACAVEVAAVALVSILGLWFSNHTPQPTFDVETISLRDKRQDDRVLPPPSTVGLPKSESTTTPKPSLAPPVFVRALPASEERTVASVPKASQLPMTNHLAPGHASISPPGHARERAHSDQLQEHPLTAFAPLSNRVTGAFDNPVLLPGQIQPAKPANELKLGEFDSSHGDAMSDPPNGSPATARVVADAGFGARLRYSMTDIYTTETRGVQKAGFDGAPQYKISDSSTFAVKTGRFAPAAETVISPNKPSPPSPSRRPEPEVEPVEILSKVLPQYTDEARRLHIQGDVILSVVFQAAGTVKVLGIVKSLGHGLDEAAEQAALKIHFKPAMRADKPFDFPATLHVEFRQG